MPRINDLSLTQFDVIRILSEHNPGAITVLIDLIQATPVIDPDNLLGGLGNMLSLDTYGIYGSNIWIFYKDLCGGDIVNVITVLRAIQLGYFREQRLLTAISKNRWDDDVDLNELRSMVQSQLPRFAFAVPIPTGEKN